MASKTASTNLPGKAILALLLVSVASSGIPLIEVHSHEDATYGHSHDAHDFFADRWAEDADTEDSGADTDSYHAHNFNATSLGVIEGISVDSPDPKQSHSYIPPPYSWHPENIVAPLYRPPIA